MTADQQPHDLNLNETLFDDDGDAAVPDIDMNNDDDEARKAIDDDLSDEKIVSEDEHKDEEVNETAFRGTSDNAS